MDTDALAPSPTAARRLDAIPSFDDLEALTAAQKRAVMPVREGTVGDAQVERMLRNVFVYAVVSTASDVHLVATGNAEKPTVRISVRGRNGLENFVYEGDSGRHFADKMFAITATPQGGSTSSSVSTRFSIELPAAYAHAHGLVPTEDEPYLVDVRVEYIKTYDGWAFTSRLLDQQRAPKYHELGLSYTLQREMRRALAEPSGLVFMSGPTGSGKTTLLNAILGLLNDDTKSICTIEQPVEYRLRGRAPIKQIPVDGKMTFGGALRSVLRHDPDLILVGEIRDQETMMTAMHAAQTGHLVFSTIHANSAPETISRALSLTESKGGRDAFALAETLKFVLAQRLLRTYEGVAAERELQSDEQAWLRANGMGFLKTVREVADGRRSKHVPIVEAIAMTPDIKALLRDDVVDSTKVYEMASRQLQYETLAAAGLRAVLGSGCQLSECMRGLETTLEAQRHPGLRLDLAQKHGLSLAQVASAIDAFCMAQDANQPGTLDDFVGQVKAQRNEPWGVQ